MNQMTRHRHTIPPMNANAIESKMQGANPYIGPRSFRRNETLYGREVERYRLLDLIIAERIVLLYSPSGAGKTSLIEAALIPTLIEERFVIRGPLRVGLPAAESTGTTSGNRYVLSTLLSLEAQQRASAQMPYEELQQSSLPQYLNLRRNELPDGAYELLIFDQFEEILTIDPTDEEAKVEFFRQVGATLRMHAFDTHQRKTDADSGRRFALFAMREESVPGLDPYLRAIPTRFHNRFRLDLLNIENAIQAIQEPAHARGVRFTDEAAALLADDLSKVRVQDVGGSVHKRSGLYIEPVQLQVVCHRLWANLPAATTTITKAHVEALGNVNRALQEYFSETVGVVAGETGVPKRSIRDWVENALITEQGIRNQIPRGVNQSGGLDNQAVQGMVDAYLVRADERRGAIWYELAHDRLVEPVLSDNAVWREANLSPLQIQAELWDQHDRPPGLLMSGAALKEIEAWADKQTIALLPHEWAFLDDCRRARRNRRTVRRGIYALILLTVVALTAFTLAFIQRREAEAARDDALISASSLLSNTALQNLAVDPAVSLYQAAAALPTQAKPRPYVASAELALVQSVRTMLERRYAPVLDDSDGALNLEHIAVAAGAAPQALIAGNGLRHVDVRTGEVNVLDKTAGTELLAWSDDLETVLTYDREQGVRAWRSLEPAAAFVPPRRVGCADLSPTHAVAALCIGREVWRWDFEHGSAPATPILQLPDRLTTLSWSPDGRWLAAWDGSGRDGQSTLTVWDEQASQAIGSLPAHATPIIGHAWLADETTTYLVTASEDGMIHVWSPSGVESEMSQSSLQGLAAIDDTRFATWSRDQPAAIWTLEGPVALLEDTAGRVTDIALSPDRSTLMTMEPDGKARLWSIDTLVAGDAQAMTPFPDLPPPPNLIAPAAVLVGHSQPIRAAIWHPSKPFVATTGLDGAVRLWDVTTGDPWAIAFGHASRDSLPGRIDIAPIAWLDHARLATIGEDGAMRTWQLFEPDGGPIRCFDPVDDRLKTPTAGALACAGHARRFRPSENRIVNARLLHAQNEVSVAATDNRGNHYAFAIADGATSPQAPPTTPYEWSCPLTYWDPTATRLVTYNDPLCLADEAPALVYEAADPSNGYVVDGPIVYAAWVDDLLVTQDGEEQVTFRAADTGAAVSEPFPMQGAMQQIVAAHNLIAAGFNTGDVYIWQRTDERGVNLVNHFPGEQVGSAPINALAVSSGEARVAFIATDTVLVAWDPFGDEVQWRLDTPNAVNAIASAPDGEEIAVADGRRLLVLNSGTGAANWCTEAHTDAIRGINWYDGPTWPYATAIHRSPTAAPCRAVLGMGVTASPSAKLPTSGTRGLILTWSGDGTARLWDRTSQAQIDQVDLGVSVTTAELDTASGLLLTGTNSGELVVWQSWALQPEALLAQACEMLRSAARAGERLDQSNASLLSITCN